MATIYFDLDGTVYDLYAQPMWLERITTLADPTIYDVEGATIYPTTDLAAVLDTLVAKGHKIGVISWLAKSASQDYNVTVRAIKRAWIAKHMPQATEVHVVKYGTPKHRVANDKSNAILVDDVADVRNAWTHGATIDASKNIMHALWTLASVRA
jgi:hypothetical protein